MNNSLLLISCLAFLVAGVWWVIQKAWPYALLALGMFLLTLYGTGIIGT